MLFFVLLDAAAIVASEAVSLAVTGCISATVSCAGTSNKLKNRLFRVMIGDWIRLARESRLFMPLDPANSLPRAFDGVYSFPGVTSVAPPRPPTGFVLSSHGAGAVVS